MKSESLHSREFLHLIGPLCMQGSYGLALNEYLHAYRHAPQEPLVLLCMGVAILNQVMHKKVPDRNRAVLQAFAFLQASF